MHIKSKPKYPPSHFVDPNYRRQWELVYILRIEESIDAIGELGEEFAKLRELLGHTPTIHEFTHRR